MRAATTARVAIIALVASLIGTAAPARARIQPGDRIPGEILVALRPDGQRFQSLRQIVQPSGEIQSAIPALRTYRIKLRRGVSSAAAIRELRSHPDVLYVEEVHRVRILATPDDPLFPNQQYGIKITHTDDSWDTWRPRAIVVIAVVDTGMDVNHPDLAEGIFRDPAGNPIWFNSQTGASNAMDDHGHGTHCAGIAGARINNTTGIAGAAGYSTVVSNGSQYIRLMPVKALDKDGNGTDADLAAGIVWAVDHGAGVVSISVGSSAQSATLNNAVKYARDQGAVVVAAAGNGAASYQLYPAACDGVISVAATDSADSLTDFSQYGSWVRAAAPGQAICSTLLGGQYGYQSGTSMSVPLVAGEAAAIRAQSPTLTNDEVANLILRHVDPYTPFSGRTIARGAGRVNVARALKAAGFGQLILTSLTVNPSTIATGETATGTVYLGTRAPYDVWIELVSNNPGVVSVPGGIIIPAGSTSASFDVMGVSASSTPVTVVAYGLGPGVSTTVSVSAPKLISFGVSPTTVTGGVKVTGTVQLDGPAAPGGTPVSITFSSQAASTSSPVVVPAGQTSTTFQIDTFPVAATTTVQVTASSGGASLQASITIKPPVISTIALNPASVVGGTPSVGTATLTGAAPAGGIVVTLTSSNKAVAQVPTNVTIPAGQASADFNITTVSVTANASVTIKGATGTLSANATLTVKPLLLSLTLAPASVTGGQNSIGTIKLNAPAPSNMEAHLSSANTSIAQLPGEVTIPQGAISVNFTISTVSVSASSTVAISTSLLGTTKSANLTVKPATLSTLVMAPSTVVGGTTSLGTVTLTGPAPAGGLAITLETTDGVVQTPASIIVPEGATQATFAATTGGVEVAKTITVYATYGTIKKSAYLTVKPPAFKTFTISPTTIKFGGQSTGTVEISGPAPAAGLMVTLKSNSVAATVPATIVIPGGATIATFTINAGSVAVNTAVTISATTLNTKKNASLTVTP